MATPYSPSLGLNPASPLSANERWFCDGVDLSGYAYGISKLENSTPEISGDFTKIPLRNGSVGRPNRSYDAGQLSLNMWVVGCNPDGSVPSYTNSSRRQLFERNLSTLLKLLGAQNKPINLQKLRLAPGPGTELVQETITGRAYCTGSTSVDTMLARQRAEVVFTFVLVDAFWTNLTTRTASVTSATLPTSVILTEMGDAPVDDSIITIKGPVASPTVTCPEAGVSFTYNGNIAAGQSLVVDSGAWTAKLGAVDVTANMSHVGHPRFMYIVPRDVPAISQIGTSLNFYPSLVLTGSGASSTTNLSVSYCSKYQVA